jgi:hypothetical protein
MPKIAAEGGIRQCTAVTYEVSLRFCFSNFLASLLICILFLRSYGDSPSFCFFNLRAAFLSRLFSLRSSIFVSNRMRLLAPTQPSATALLTKCRKKILSFSLTCLFGCGTSVRGGKVISYSSSSVGATDRASFRYPRASISTRLCASIRRWCGHPVHLNIDTLIIECVRMRHNVGEKSIRFILFKSTVWLKCPECILRVRENNQLVEIPR